ncbi:hypothetical protein [Streptomyces chartreusis]|uniref:hypothetical protein n=1 Tax=Streptomyces chartreusis TaxID=1969 RepID=UPI003694F6B3
MTADRAVPTNAVQVTPGPVCLMPRDTFTGRPPALPVTAVVERRDDDGRWSPEKSARVVTTPTGARLMPSLAVPAGRPPGGEHGVCRMRVRLVSPYLLDAEHPDGVEFDAPAPGVPAVTPILLLPLPAYPFPPETRLLGGRVVARRPVMPRSAAGPPPGAPVVGALVTAGARHDPGHIPPVGEPWTDFAATARDGAFRLPLRGPGSRVAAGAAADGDTEWFTVTVTGPPGRGGPPVTVHLPAQDITSTGFVIEVP